MFGDGSSSDDDPSFFPRMRQEKKRPTTLTPFELLVLEATRDAESELRDNSPLKKSRAVSEISSKTAALSISGNTSPRSQAAAALLSSHELCGSPYMESVIPTSPISPMGSSLSPLSCPILANGSFERRAHDLGTSPTGPLLIRPSASIHFGSNGIKSSPSRFSELNLGRSPPKALLPHMKIAQQPPPRAVYKRILRPCPTVAIISELKAHEHLLENLFVEVDLVAADQSRDFNEHLEGNRVTRVTPRNPAVFNKLKINVTSAMLGSSLRLVFRLKRFLGTTFETLPDTLVSSVVEVFSHTLYLHGLKEGEKDEFVALPTVAEVIPASGSKKGGHRVCLLGEGFVDSKKLVVKFGSEVVPAAYHEDCSIIAVTPAQTQAGLVSVRVSNDGGVSFSDAMPPVFYEYK